nr:putative magnesium transporter nipa1 [Quercus suber]
MTRVWALDRVSSDILSPRFTSMNDLCLTANQRCDVISRKLHVRFNVSHTATRDHCSLRSTSAPNQVMRNRQGIEILTQTPRATWGSRAGVRTLLGWLARDFDSLRGQGVILVQRDGSSGKLAFGDLDNTNQLARGSGFGREAEEQGFRSCGGGGGSGGGAESRDDGGRAGFDLSRGQDGEADQVVGGGQGDGDAGGEPLGARADYTTSHTSLCLRITASFSTLRTSSRHITGHSRHLTLVPTTMPAGGSWTNLSPAASVALGIIVGLLSTCVQSIGLTLQRKSHMLEDEKPHSSPRRPAYRRRRWQVGMLLFLIANIVGSTIQITTLPLPLLSTLQASGLVFNSLLASLLLKEPWTWRTVYGTLLVAGGAVLISLFSALPEKSHSLDQLLRLLKMRGFLTWFILSLVVVLGVLVFDLCARKVVSQARRDSPRLHFVRGMSYGFISGILSAHALLLAKSAVELIVNSFSEGQNQFKNYRSWLLVLTFLVLALSQLYYLHLGLKLISTSILYPFVFCIYNIVAILDGLIYFRQMDELPPLHAGLIAVGTVVLLAGVLALSWRLHDEDDSDPDHPVHHGMAKAEIPQTVLAPGMGFVGDPDDDEVSEDDDDQSAIADEDDLDQEEQSPLLNRRGKRKSTSGKSMKSLGSALGGRKRRRAATLKEVVQIWEEVRQDPSKPSPDASVVADGDYGTVRSGRTIRVNYHRRRSSGVQFASPSDTNTAIANGVTTAGDGSPDGDVTGLEPGVTSLHRAKTMPNAIQRTSRSTGARSSSGTVASGRRKSGHHPHSGALFSDMLKRDWWRGKRRQGQEDEDEDDPEDT